MKITFIDHLGAKTQIDVPAEGSLMEAARAADIEAIVDACAGNCSCCTCMVHVDPAYFAKSGTISADEAELLSERDDRTDTSRLSCQVVLTGALDGLVVTTPEFQE